MRKRKIVFVALIIFILSSSVLLLYFIPLSITGAAIATQTVESTNNVGKFSSIALDANGKVHISFQDVTNSDLRYCNNTAGSWSCVAVDTIGTGEYTSITIDSNNKVHISHLNETGAANRQLRYCNNTASDGSWSCIVIDGTTTSNLGQYSSIAIDTNNKVHISYKNSVDLDLKYCNNTASDSSWSCATIDSANNVGQYSSIAIDSNNKVHISYQKVVLAGSGTLRYCNNTAGSWSCIDVDTGSGSEVGRDISIAFDSNNKAHISYQNYTSRDLKYCNNTAGSWSCANIETANDVGFSTSITIDSNNKVHISHYDDTNDDLRYCNNTASDGSWSCAKLADADANSLGTPNGRALAIKKGRIVDSTSFSSKVHISWYNNTDLIYTSVDYDTIAPSISIVYPANNTNTSNTGIDVNYTVSDNLNELSSCWYSNDSMTLNTTITCGQNITTITWGEGQHNVTVWANDSVNNVNRSSVTFRVDSIAPAININYPLNNTNTSDINIDVNYTVSDSGIGLSSCWYSNDTYLLNTTLANCVNITTVIWSEGLHNVTVWANDSVNNVNSSSVTFTIDTIVPLITKVIPLDFYNYSRTNMEFNISLNEIGSFCSVTLNNWLINYTMTKFNNTYFNFTNSSIANGNYLARYWCNDSVGNINNTERVNFTLDSIPPNVSAFYNTLNNGNYSRTIVVNVSVADTTIGMDSVYFNITNSSNKQVNFTKASNPGGIYYNISIDTTKFTDGKYNITVYANDTLNNLNNTEKISITFDNNAPTASFTCSPSSITVGQTVTCGCSPSDATSGVNNSATSYTTNPSTVNTGTFTLTCTFADMAGNSASVITQYIVESAGRGRIAEIVTEAQPTETVSLEVITPEQPAEVVLTNPEIDLTKFIINVKETIQNVSLEVTEVDISQADLQVLSGIIYQAFEINTKGIDDTNIKYAVIEFKVNKTWLSEQGGSVDDVTLLRKQEKENEWNSLDTTFVGEDSSFYYFSAISPGFSTFVVFVGTQKCILGEIRCFDNQLQVCLGNYMWRIIEECRFGCKDNKCIPMPFRFEKTLFAFGVIIGLISAGIIILAYFIYKKIRIRKKEEKSLEIPKDRIRVRQEIEKKEKIIESKEIEKPIEKIEKPIEKTKPLSLNLKIKNLREEIGKRGIREVEIPKEKKHKRAKVKHRDEIKLLEGEIEKLKKKTVDDLLNDTIRMKEINKAFRKSHYDSKKIENLKKEIREKGIKGVEIYKKGKKNYF